MPAESTFDIVSEYDRQEIVNTVDQTLREVRSRFDLKDTKTSVTLNENDITIETDSEMTLSAVRDILQTKAIRRNLSIKVFKLGEVQDVAGGRVRQVITLQKGIADDVARRLQKLIRDQFPKVQARIQGDALRVGSKSRDELQSVIKALRERQDEFTIPLQFTNYR
jgi:uncharacterized protein YajQ (UPF0234 family)